MINTWNESLLHEELKDYYCDGKGLKEVHLEGSICDIVFGDGSIVEIQTVNLGKLKTKLEKLLANHPLTLVYPIAENTHIETYGIDRNLISRRKSPKHGTIFQLFRELTKIYPLLDHPNFTLTVVFADIIEIRIADGKGSWRRKGVRLEDRKLSKIHSFRNFSDKTDYAALLPQNLAEIFTVADLKKIGAGNYAGYMAWVMRNIGIIKIQEKKGNAYCYARVPLDKNR